MNFKLLLMKTKSLIILAGLFLFFCTSCSEQHSFTKKITGDWWPVHASGSMDNEVFTASWDGDLGDHGEIIVVCTSKDNPSLTVKKTVFYPALSFSKDTRKNESVRTVDLSSRDLKTSNYLKYKVENGTFYMETVSAEGTPTGEFGEGQSYKFLDDNTLKIGNVTYEAYSYYRKKHQSNSIVEMGGDSDYLPIRY